MTDDRATPDATKPSSDAPDKAKASAPAEKPSPAKPRKRRRWPYVVGGLFVGLLLLVALTPTIASTGVARSFVVSKINDNLKGSVEIAHWSISWTGGITVTGVKIFDNDKQQVGQLDRLTTQLKLTDAIGMNLAIGETNIDGADFTFTKYADGSTTLDKLLKPTPEKPDEPASDLPRLSGKVTIRNARFTYADRTTSTMVKAGLDGVVNIPDLLNAPIENQLNLTAAVGNDATAAPGTITVAGKSSVVANKRIDLDAATVEQTVTLAGLDAAAARSFAPPKLFTELAGVFGGKIDVKLAGGKSVEFEVKLTGSNVAVATKDFQGGEVYRSPSLTFDLPKTTLSLPQGIAKFDAGAIKIGDGKMQELVVSGEAFRLTLAADASISALLAAAKNERIAGDGFVRQSLTLHPPKLAGQLKQTIGLKPDVRIDKGEVVQSLAMVMSNGKWRPEFSLRADAAGSAEFTDDQGKTVRREIAVEPIDVKVHTDFFGGGWKTPDLRNLSIAIKSGFVNGAIGANSLADLSGAIEGDLADFQKQIAQFRPLDPFKFEGKLVIGVGSRGDPLKIDAPAEIGVSVVLTNLRIVGLVEGKSIDQPLVQLDLRAILQRAANGDLKSFKDLSIAVLTGSEASPSVDIALAMPEVLVIAPADPAKGSTRVDVPAFSFTRGSISLDKLQQEFAALLPADLKITGGIRLTGGGAMVNGKTRFDGQVALQNAGVTRTVRVTDNGLASAISHPVEILKAYNLTTDVAAEYATDPAGNASATVTKLVLHDNQNLLSLANVGEFKALLPKVGQPMASGQLKLNHFDLGRANEMLRAMNSSAKEIIATASGEDADVTLRKGKITGVVSLSQPAAGAMKVEMTGEITDVTLAGAKPGDMPLLANEKLTITLKAVASDNFASASLDQLDLVGTTVTVSANAKVQLREGPAADAKAVAPLAMVRSGSVKITAPGLEKLQAIVDALPKTKPPAGPTPATPTPSTPATNEPSFLDQLAEVRVAELNVSALGTTVTLKQPITARGLADLPALFGGTAFPGGEKTPGGSPVPPPAPPTKLAGGSATISLNLSGDGKELRIDPDVQAKNVLLSVGERNHLVGDVTLKARTALVMPPVAAAKVPAATAKPAVAAPRVADPTRAHLAGAFTVTGNLEPLLQLQNVLAGKEPVSQYAGTFTLDESITTENGKIKLTGGGVVADFVSRDAQGKPAFTEKAIRLVNAVALDSRDKGAFDLQQVRLAFESSNALALDLTGRISDLSGARNFENVVANVSYDGEPLWKIIRPMLTEPGTPPEKDRYKDYVVRGKSTRRFLVGGSFPAVDDAGKPVAFNVGIRSLTASGSFGLDLIDAEGMKIEKFDVPIDLRGGVLRLADLSKGQGQQYSPPAACNGGTFNVNGLIVDLTSDEFPTLSAPNNLPILTNVQLNAALANFLGEFFNNPAMVKPGGSDGVINLALAECRYVPLGAEAKKHSKANRGYARATYDFGGLQLGTEGFAKLASGIGVEAASLRGSVRNGEVIYNNGFVYHNMTLALGQDPNRTLHFYGNVELASGNLMPLTVLVSNGILRQALPENVARFIPKGLPLAMTGPFSAPKYDFNAAVQETVKQNFTSGKPEDIGNLIDLFRKKDDKPKNPAGGGAAAPATKAADQPAAKPSDNPLGVLGGLLDQAAKDREKKEQEKKEKERKEREKKQQQQKQ